LNLLVTLEQFGIGDFACLCRSRGFLLVVLRPTNRLDIFAPTSRCRPLVATLGACIIFALRPPTGKLFVSRRPLFQLAGELLLDFVQLLDHVRDEPALARYLGQPCVPCPLLRAAPVMLKTGEDPLLVLAVDLVEARGDLLYQRGFRFDVLEPRCVCVLLGGERLVVFLGQLLKAQSQAPQPARASR